MSSMTLTRQCTRSAILLLPGQLPYRRRNTIRLQLWGARLLGK
jgi:hypothetical protein